MNNNQSTQQIKSDPKGKAMASLIVGIISLLLLLIWAVELWCFISSRSIGCNIEDLFKKLPIELQMVINTFQIPLLPVIGLILGIFGLKSTKKDLAKIGIIMCGVSFICSLIILLYGFLYSLGL